MSFSNDVSITRDGDEAVGYTQSKHFEIDLEKEEVFFYKSRITWAQLERILEYINEERELNAEEPEKPPF